MMKRFLRPQALAAAVAFGAAGALAGGPAHAALSLTIDEVDTSGNFVGNLLTINDNDVSDEDNTLGEIEYEQVIGGFDLRVNFVEVDTGQGQGLMIQSFSAKVAPNSAGQAIRLTAFEDAFTAAQNPITVFSEITPSTNESNVKLEFNSKVDGTDIIANQTLTGTGSGALATQTTPVAVGANFSISHITTLTANSVRGGTGADVAFDARTQTVPLPATLGLLGAGLIGLGVVSRRRKAA